MLKWIRVTSQTSTGSSKHREGTFFHIYRSFQVAITRSTFYNSTGLSGCVTFYAMYAMYTPIRSKLHDCIFKKCKSLTNDPTKGGGAARYYSSFGKLEGSFKGCRFLRNSAMKLGGALFIIINIIPKSQQLIYYSVLQFFI